MAIFQTKVWTRVENVPQPKDAAVLEAPVKVEFHTANYAVNDIIQLARIPIGVTLHDFTFVFPDIDSNGTPTIAWSIGELNAGGTDLSTVYQAAITAGQSNAIVRGANSDASQVSTATERRIGLKVTTAAATYNGSGKTGVVVLGLRA